MPKFERQNSHFIKFTDEIYKFEEKNARENETNLENVIDNLEALRSKEKSKTEEISRLDMVFTVNPTTQSYHPSNNYIK